MYLPEVEPGISMVESWLMLSSVNEQAAWSSFSRPGTWFTCGE